MHDGTARDEASTNAPTTGAKSDASTLTGEGAAAGAIASDGAVAIPGSAGGGSVRERAAAYVREHDWVVDAALLVAITAVAGVLRLVLLGNVPYGIHPDEAQVGTDAHRILAHGWIGVYTPAALGQPSGHAYLTTPSIWLLGNNAFALRLPLALVGLAAIPLLYLLVRVAIGRVEAAFASGMLAVSYWHLFYSRVAHWSISYGTVVLAVLLCLMLGLRGGRRAWAWYAAAGALLGLGVYTYNIYPIAIVAVGAFLAIMTVRVLLAERARRRTHDAGRTVGHDVGANATEPGDGRAAGLGLRPPELRLWLIAMGVFALAALIVATPMINYLRNPDAIYWQHFNNYESVRVTRTPEYAAAGTWEKLGLILGQAKYFASAYAWHGRPDYVDGNGLRPIFDPLTLALLLVGLVFAWKYRRNALIIAALCCFVIIPLPAVPQTGSIMREPVGAAPYAMLFAALPLAAAWRWGMRRRDVVPRWLPAGAACVAVVVIGAWTVRDYFGKVPGDDLTRFVYSSQVTSASTFMSTLPEGSYVYFYSDRWPFHIETRQYLAPDVQGQDRSEEFAGEISIPTVDPAQRSVFIVLGRYEPMLTSIEARYPGGRETIETRDGKFEFAAYEVGGGAAR
ncbi:MAG TPA: glycosyltransferase family 39 protein [Dehalococcoidia bacterium]|nr:glycosyltransferase family 39 protein [Dehalococcoidia bacterium]